jgi:hypothetical protein
LKAYFFIKKDGFAIFFIVYDLINHFFYKGKEAMTKTFTKVQIVEKVGEMIEGLFSEIEFIDGFQIKHEIRKGEGPDLVVEFVSKGEIHVLLIEARVSGEPRLAREAVNSLLVEMGLWSYAFPVFVAPYISKESAYICRSKNVGYMDLAGNCHLCFDNIFIHSEGKVNLFKTKRRLKSLFRPKSGRIIRVLLNNPLREWQTQELAQEAGVSMGLVSNVKKILKDKEWIDGKKRKIVLTNPCAILEKWVAHASEEQVDPIGFYYSPLNILQIENSIVGHCFEKNYQCAFTGLSGAVHLVSDIDYYQVHAYVLGDINSFNLVPGFEKNHPKANIVLIQTADEGLFYRTRPVMPISRLQYYRPTDKTVKAIEEEIKNGMQIVSPVQVYFDLMSKLRSSGDEADKVFRQVLQPSW